MMLTCQIFVNETIVSLNLSKDPKVKENLKKLRSNSHDSFNL